MVVLTRIDSENIDEAALMESLRTNFGEHVIPLNFPDQFGPGVSKIHNVFGADLPKEVQERAEELRRQVTEAVAESDDKLIEKYFAEGAITKAELFHAFPKAIRGGHIVPVLHTSAKKEFDLLVFLVEVTLLVLPQLYVFPGVPHDFSLFPGRLYQFPLYQSLFAAVFAIMVTWFPSSALYSNPRSTLCGAPVQCR